MSDLLPPAVAIAIVSTPREPAPFPNDRPPRQLIGVALLEVSQVSAGEFLYGYGARSISKGASEDLLIDWLSERLPAGPIVIGWRLGEEIVPTLLGASEAATPDDAKVFVEALARTLTIDAVDLADTCPESRSFRDLCAAGDIGCWSTDEEEVVAAWQRGRQIEVLGMLVSDVVAAWRAWAQPQRPGNPAIARFANAVLENWIVDDDDMQPRLWRDEEVD